MEIATFLVFQRIRIVGMGFPNQLFDFLIECVKILVGNQPVGIYNPMEVLSVESKRKEFIKYEAEAFVGCRPQGLFPK